MTCNVAFIGLGVMGYPMAGYISKGGHNVTVFNRTKSKAEKWTSEYKGKMAETPAEAAKDAEYIFTCVGNDNDLREVTFGSNGAFKTIKKGAIYIDNTTASATIAREIYDYAKKNGFGSLDAPVSGGQAGAENGALTWDADWLLLGSRQPSQAPRTWSSPTRTDARSSARCTVRPPMESRTCAPCMSSIGAVLRTRRTLCFLLRSPAASTSRRSRRGRESFARARARARRNSARTLDPPPLAARVGQRDVRRLLALVRRAQGAGARARLAAILRP